MFTGKKILGKKGGLQWVLPALRVSSTLVQDWSGAGGEKNHQKTRNKQKSKKLREIRWATRVQWRRNQGEGKKNEKEKEEIWGKDQKCPQVENAVSESWNNEWD